MLPHIRLIANAFVEVVAVRKKDVGLWQLGDQRNDVHSDDARPFKYKS